MPLGIIDLLMCWIACEYYFSLIFLVLACKGQQENKVNPVLCETNVDTRDPKLKKVRVRVRVRAWVMWCLECVYYVKSVGDIEFDT